MDEKKASIIGAVATSAINLATLSLPETTAGIFSAISPIVQGAIERGLSTMGAARLSDREKHRIGSTVWWATRVIEDNLRVGKNVMQSQIDQERIDAFVESVFRAASEDAQEKKDKAYGVFLGNFAFQDKFDGGALFTMAQIIKELSLDELLLIAALNGRPGMNYEEIFKKFEQDGDLRCGEMVGFFTRLRNLGLVIRVLPISMASGIGCLKLSARGEALCDLAKLQEIDPEQYNSLRQYLDLFAKPAES